MFHGDKNVENLKEIITLEPIKELFKQHCHYDWTWAIFIHTLKNKSKKDKWNYFVDQFHELSQVLQ
jgi:hypothetical protein